MGAGCKMANGLFLTPILYLLQPPAEALSCPGIGRTWYLARVANEIRAEAARPGRQVADLLLCLCLDVDENRDTRRCM